MAGLTGVRNLSDDIEISNDADPVDVTVYVQDALDRYALILDDSDVTVDTDGNTVTLPGTSAPGPSTTRWSTPRGWLSASTTSATTCTSPAETAPAETAPADGGASGKPARADQSARAALPSPTPRAWRGPRGRACRGCAGRRRGYPACEPRTYSVARAAAGIPDFGRMEDLKACAWTTAVRLWTRPSPRPLGAACSGTRGRAGGRPAAPAP